MEDNQQTNQDKKPLIIGIIAIALIVVLVGAVIALTGKEEAATTSSSDTSQPTATINSTAAAPVAAGNYKDGTYNATGTYNSPGGTEEIAVTITINGNTISDATVTPQAASSTSKQYQSEFVAGYKKLVIGKNIDEVKLTKVSGSSLTPRGFNDALDEIRSEAKS